MPAKKKDDRIDASVSLRSRAVGKKKKIVIKKGKGKPEVKRGVPIDFSGVKKQEVYMRDPFKPELYPRVQGHESILKAAYGQLGGRVLQGGGGIVGMPGRMLTQQTPPQMLPPSFPQIPQQQQMQNQGFESLLKYMKEQDAIDRKNQEAAKKIVEENKRKKEQEEKIQEKQKGKELSFEKFLESIDENPVYDSSLFPPKLSPQEFQKQQEKQYNESVKTQYEYDAFKAKEKLYKDTFLNLKKNYEKNILQRGEFFKEYTPRRIRNFFNILNKEGFNQTQEEKSNLAFLKRILNDNKEYFEPKKDVKMTEVKPPEETGKISTQTGTLLDVIRAQEKGQPPSMSIDEFLEKGPPPKGGGGGGGRSEEEELARSKLPPAMKPQQQMPDIVVQAHSGAFTSPLGESMYSDELVTVPSPRPLDYYASGVEAELEPGLKNIVSERRLAKLQDWADDRARYLEYKRLEKEYENSLIPFEDIRAGLIRKEMGRVYKFPWDVVQSQQYQRINPEGEEISYSEEPADFIQFLD